MHYFGRTVETLLLRFGKVSGSCQVWGTTSPTHTPSRSVAMGLLMQLPTYESRPRTEIVISMRLQLLLAQPMEELLEGLVSFPSSFQPESGSLEYLEWPLHGAECQELISEESC